MSYTVDDAREEERGLWMKQHTQECADCGAVWVQVPTKTHEQDDRDGNRGIDMFCVVCPTCNTEFCWFGN